MKTQRPSYPPFQASEEHPQPAPPAEPEAPPPQEIPPQPEPSEQKENGEGEEVETASYAWDDIATAPRDGSDVMVRYEDEGEPRLVRWKLGRRFDGRKWIAGGRWVPAESLMPLPAVEPTHWARPAGYGEPAIEELPTEEAA